MQIYAESVGAFDFYRTVLLVRVLTIQTVRNHILQSKLLWILRLCVQNRAVIQASVADTL
jgi:hypothetical protein